MTTRITSQMQANLMLTNINADLAALDNTQNELSTGLKITKPSDDPYGTSLSMQLNGQLSALGSYSNNVNDGTAWATTATTALQSIQQIVQRARELAVEGANGTTNQSEMTDMAAEIDQLADGLKESGNTQYNGMYVFAGTATSTKPWQTGTGSSDAFAGNTAAINRAVGPGTTIQVNVDLSSVLGSGSGDGKLLDSLRTISADLRSGNATAVGNELATIDTNTSALEQVQASVGAGQDRLTMAASRIQSMQSTDQTVLSQTQDVDMGQAAIAFSTEQAGYSAALQSAAKIIQTSLLNFLQ